MSNNGSQLLGLHNHSLRPSQTVVFHVFPTFPYLNGLCVSQDKNVQHVHVWVLLEDVGLGVVLEVAVVPPVCRGTLGKENKEFSSMESCSQGGIAQSLVGTKVMRLRLWPKWDLLWKEQQAGSGGVVSCYETAASRRVPKDHPY